MSVESKVLNTSLMLIDSHQNTLNTKTIVGGYNSLIVFPTSCPVTHFSRALWAIFEYLLTAQFARKLIETVGIFYLINNIHAYLYLIIKLCLINTTVSWVTVLF